MVYYNSMAKKNFVKIIWIILVVLVSLSMVVSMLLPALF